MARGLYFYAGPKSNCKHGQYIGCKEGDHELLSLGARGSIEIVGASCIHFPHLHRFVGIQI